MNPNFIREEINKHLNSRISVKVFGMRNKINNYEGYIKATYPNIFTIQTLNGEKSFTYADVITKDIEIKYL